MVLTERILETAELGCSDRGALTARFRPHCGISILPMSGVGSMLSKRSVFSIGLPLSDIFELRSGFLIRRGCPTNPQ
jgi:hypothetical protein